MVPTSPKADGTDYYEYLLVYTDDLMAISMDPKAIIDAVDQHFLIKPSSIGKPDTYLGAQCGEYQMGDIPGKVRWYMSLKAYTDEAIKMWKVGLHCTTRSYHPRYICLYQ